MEAAGMGATLNLSECLLAMAVEAQDQGRTRDACNILQRLVSFRDLPRPMAEECHARLSEQLIADKQFGNARRHLAILMCLRPSHGKYYYLFGKALHRDPKGDPDRAAEYYKKALDLDPTQSKWWSSYGKLLIEIGRTTDAIDSLTYAHEISEHDPVIVRRLVEALCLNDQESEARELLRLARFEHPRDHRFRKLWNDFQFQNAVKVQQGDRAEDPVLLPFVRIATKTDGTSGPGKILRMDEARPTSQSRQHSTASQKDG
jgi:tetratricopeptide (TPR) repeat protein